MNIGLLGCGNVGHGVQEILDADTKHDVKIEKILVRRPRNNGDDRFTLVPEDVTSNDKIDLACEFMGGVEPAAEFVRTSMKNGKHVVTANKKMLAECMPEMFRIANENGVELFFEASVGGGIPWISNIRNIREVDEVFSFRGIINGTTNYILSSMEDGKDFEVVLREAQELGYAEPDPTDDIDGFDTRYKTVISCEEAFDAYVRPEEIPVFGIRHISSTDMKYAKDNEKTIKLLSRVVKNGDSISASVMPCMIGFNSELANVKANSNAIELTSSNLGKLLFIGQGAGTYPTSHAVVQDVLAILNGKKYDYSKLVRGSIDNGAASGVFYIRTAKPDVFADIEDSRTGDGAVITDNTDLGKILQLVSIADDPELFIAEVLQ